MYYFLLIPGLLQFRSNNCHPKLRFFFFNRKKMLHQHINIYKSFSLFIFRCRNDSILYNITNLLFIIILIFVEFIWFLIFFFILFFHLRILIFRLISLLFLMLLNTLLNWLILFLEILRSFFLYFILFTTRIHLLIRSLV